MHKKKKKSTKSILKRMEPTKDRYTQKLEHVCRAIEVWLLRFLKQESSGWRKHLGLRMVEEPKDQKNTRQQDGWSRISGGGENGAHRFTRSHLDTKNPLRYGRRVDSLCKTLTVAWARIQVMDGFCLKSFRRASLLARHSYVPESSSVRRVILSTLTPFVP